LTTIKTRGIEVVVVLEEEEVVVVEV